MQKHINKIITKIAAGKIEIFSTSVHTNFVSWNVSVPYLGSLL